jgi:hypothetical protein
LIAEGTLLEPKPTWRRFWKRPARDPFAARTCGARPLEDAYLFGVRLRAVARAGRESEARRLMSRLGTPEDAGPSLEDVFVSLARRKAVVPREGRG